jgi:hypothetical protein
MGGGGSVGRGGVGGGRGHAATRVNAKRTRLACLAAGTAVSRIQKYPSKGERRFGAGGRAGKRAGREEGIYM